MFCLSNSAPLLSADPPPPPPAAHVIDVVAHRAAMLPPKRPAYHFARLFPVFNPKRRALSVPGEPAHYSIWGRFEVDEQEGDDDDEKKNVQPAPETLDSELARWFAQNPPYTWDCFLSLTISICDLTLLFSSQGVY